MQRFKVYLRSGTVLTIAADKWWGTDNGFLYFDRNGEIIGHFAAGMWEGIQNVTPAPKETEKSGS